MDSSVQEMVCNTLRWLKARRRRIATLMAGTTLGVCIYWLYFSGLYQGQIVSFIGIITPFIARFLFFFFSFRGYRNAVPKLTTVICDADQLFINVVARWPGSVHDARILRESPLFGDFESDQPPLDGLLLGDSGYMQRTWLMTPLQNPDTRQEHRYNFSHSSTRTIVERSIGVAKQRWQCLRYGLRLQPAKACRVIAGQATIFIRHLLKSKIPVWSRDQGRETNQLDGSGHGWSDWEAVERDLAARAARYRNVCSQLTEQPKKPSGRVLYYLPQNISYCLVQKAGCTFWKRVFFFLHGAHPARETVKSLFDIKRYYVHHVGSRRVKKHKYFYNSEDNAMIDRTVKFMFTRDPYARLWSFYVDKLVLPDSWLDIGKQILKHRDSGRRKECADDISFEEYLDHAINRQRNNHWKPIITVCNPCVFQPTYLGKMETFSRDSRFILKKAGLEHLLDGHGSKSHVEDEVRMLTDSMFRIYQHRQARLQHCLSLVDLTQRLWQAFVYNGYIDEKLTFPRQEVSDKLQNVHDVMEAYDFARDLLIRALRQSPRRTSRELKEYKRDVLVKQFRAVSSRILEQIVKHYAVDFAMFDYEPRPADIFASSSSDVDTTSTTTSVSSRT